MTGNVCVSSDTFPVTLGVPKKPTIKAPIFVFTNKPFPVTGTTEGANQQANIMLLKGVWGIDWLASDEILETITSDGEGNFETELTFEEIGYNKIYVGQKKEWWGIDILAKDIKSLTHSIFVIDWWILGVLGAVILYYMYEKGMLDKFLKKPKRRKG